MNWELSDVQAGFRKGRGTKDQITSICWIIEKAREFQENIYFIDYTEAFDCVDHNCEKFFKKIRHTKGTFQAKMGTIKDRYGMDLTEAEDI